MAKQWPDYMGTYKGMVLEYGLTKTQKGLPQFVVKLFLTEYYDQKESQWYDVSDNNWSVAAYLCLYGRKDSKADGELVCTLNHTQVCKVFDWDGCGFTHLTTPGTFDGKVVQVRISENTYEGAKTPIQVDWIDTEGADPTNQLKTLDPTEVKKLEAEFASLFPKKVMKAASAPKAAAPTAKKTVKAAAKTEPPAAPANPDPAPAEEAPAPLTPEQKRQALLEKSKRLLAANKKAETPKPATPVKAPTKAQPEKAAETAKTVEPAIPDGYYKRQAWTDVCDLKSADCTDDTLNAAWEAAVAETAEGGDEVNLDE